MYRDATFTNSQHTLILLNVHSEEN